MTLPSIGHTRSRRGKAWAQAVAILVGVVPIYAMTIWSHVTRERPMTLTGMFLYPAVVGGVSIVVIYLLLRFPCGEKAQDLNRRAGRWWQDLLVGLVLVAITLSLHMLLQEPINRAFPREPMTGLGDLFGGLAENRWLFALFTGHVLGVGVGFEEVVRVFLLSRLWKIWPSVGWQWAGVLLSAALFGPGHIYQGPAGVVATAVSGIVLAVYYLFFGRGVPHGVVPLPP